MFWLTSYATSRDIYHQRSRVYLIICRFRADLGLPCCVPGRVVLVILVSSAYFENHSSKSINVFDELLSTAPENMDFNIAWHVQRMKVFNSNI